MSQNLLDALRERVLVLDGGMGTMMQRRGLPVGGCGDLWNLDNPDAVVAVQRNFVEAGSDVIFTNTFGANRFRLGAHGEGDRLRELNEAAVRIAREAMRESGWVIGDLGPTGAMIEPLGTAKPEEVQASYREEAEILLRAGVDALIVETQLSLEEISLGLSAAREAMEAAGVQVPLIGSMAYDKMNQGVPRTMWGVEPRQAAETMMASDVDVLGFNCGHSLERDECLAILGVYREVGGDKPLMAKPNAGTPTQEDGKIVYHLAPEEMAAWTEPLVEAGARLLGGCCGTTPDHIRAYRKAVDSLTAPA